VIKDYVDEAALKLDTYVQALLCICAYGESRGYTQEGNNTEEEGEEGEEEKKWDDGREKNIW